jgi:hypothetical protein
LNTSAMSVLFPSNVRCPVTITLFVTHRFDSHARLNSAQAPATAVMLYYNLGCMLRGTVRHIWYQGNLIMMNLGNNARHVAGVAHDVIFFLIFDYLSYIT